ncbi:conserved hypothetical protein [Flavobacterium sp. 9AF]|uniref:hypothetical protein n=1 Tax=Flavobacterium sp. 9AF TaxID=2653142 RepID=UPI0012F1BB3A|nr:hypothetical protein [Flavobacterium sp. 9AF]VXB82265.1 conserved hypothetical protein [Flavobacterium sp. 9AF]
METNSPFKKIQVIISLKEMNNDIRSVNIIAVEVGFPNSSGAYIWKSSSRLWNTKNQTFLKTKNRNGNEIDALVPSTWNDMTDSTNAFVFDFVKNEKPSILKIRTQILTTINTNEVKEYEVLETAKTFSTSFLNVTIAEKVIGID